MLSNIVTGIKAVAGSLINPDANDASAQPPSRDSSPLPASRDLPPAPESTPTVIDLSSPPQPPRRYQQENQRAKPSLSQPSKRSEDEKRLVGDYEVPADAVDIPDPLSWMGEQQKMLPKPGANRGYKPVDTLNNLSRTTNRKPTTYGKHARRSLIGQSPGPGQTAYAELQRSKAPTTPGQHTRDEEDQWTGGSAKRRKTKHVITLDDDEDEATRTGAFAHGKTLDERPLSARSSQSRLSVGSAGADFKPYQTTNEFREVVDLIRPSQKKPRQPSCHKQGNRQSSPFGSGSMSTDAHNFILRDFQQGEPSSLEHERHGGIGQSVTSKHFPNARINESTTEQPRVTRIITSNSPNLRTQHRPVPKQVGRAEDSDSVDELAISPTTNGKMTQSPKAKKVTHSNTKKKGHGKDGSVVWPLSFARSYEFDGTGSKMEDGHTTLVLRIGPEGLRVQKYDTEGYETVMLIASQQVTQVIADDAGRIRLVGPRASDGNVNYYDFQFLNSSDFSTFCNTHAASLTTRGKVVQKEEDYMRKLFATPLTLRNDKVKTPEILSNDVQNFKNQNTHHEQAEKHPLARPRRAERGIDNNSASATKIEAPVLTRSSRSRLPAPTRILDDDPDVSEVSKYSIDTGLGRPWVKALEYGEGRQRAIVHFDDLPRLDEEEYLNDSLIDFYMIYLFQKLQVPAEKVYFFNTYFFTRLTENAGRKSMNYKAVERWTSKIDIFSYDYIVVPINESQTHWYLAIICNVSNIQRKPVLADFDEPHPYIQEPSEVCTTPTVASENEEHMKLPVMSGSNSPARVEQVQDQQEEDPNLFDEVTISLVDRDDTGAGACSSVGAHESNTVSLDSEAEPTETLQATADAEPTSQGRMLQSLLTSVKSKNRRKNVPKRDPHQPVVVVLDSLGGVARSGAVRILKDWIAEEGRSKRGMEAVIKENGYYPRGTQIPMQKNWTDCGVYLLGYIEKFFQNPDEFMHKLLTGSMSASEDWPELNPSMMRHKMRDVIFECYKQQEEARKAKKKAKKEPAKPKTSPDAAANQSTDGGIVPLPVGELPVAKSPDPKMNEQHEQHVVEKDLVQAKSTLLSPRLRLGSPFDPKNESGALAKLSKSEATVEETDLPAPIASSARTASAACSNTLPRRHGPEVRISNIASHSDEPTSDARSSAIRSPDQTEPTDQDRPRSSGLNKRRRPDNYDHTLDSPDAKRSQKRPSLEGKGDDGRVAKASSPHGREGSAPNAPIEIQDSQELEVVHPGQRDHVQSRHLACRLSPHLSRPTAAVSSSPSLEEIPRLPSKAEIGGRRRCELSEGDHVRRSAAPDRSMPRQASHDGEEGSQDPVDLISQSTDQMQLDGIQSSEFVRETPEPGRESPMLG